MVKLMHSLVQLKFLGSFVIWFSWMLRRWMILLDSSLYQLLSGFVQVYVFSTFEFDAVSFIGFLTRILINGFFEFWTFVLSLIFENSRSKFMLKLMQLLCRFEFWNTLVELDFFAGLRMILAVLFFLRGFPEDQFC